MPQSFDELVQATQDSMNGITEQINAAKEDFGNGLKTEAEHREELNKLVGEIQQEMVDLKENIENNAKERMNTAEGLLRPQSGTPGVDRLSPMELQFAMHARYGTSDVAVLEQAQDNIQERMTIDSVDEHFAALEAADPDHALDITHPRRRTSDALRNAQHAQVINSLTTASAGVVEMAGSEMFPLLLAGSTVMAIIPVEPRLAGTGVVATIVPFTAAKLVINRDPTRDLTDTGVGGGTPVRLNAEEMNVLIKIADSHIQDYSFGDLIQDAVQPTLRRAGYNLDEILLFGDTEATQASNINRIAGGDASTDFRTAFDGLAKRSILAGSSDSRNIDASTWNLDTVMQAHSSLGQDYGLPYTDIYMVAPLRQMNALLTVDNVVRIQIGAPGEINIGGPVNSLSGIRFLVHDGTLKRDADGKVSNTAANNTHDSAVMFNRNVVIQGFSRPLSTIVRQAPQGMYQNVMIDLRWAESVGLYDGVATLNNLPTG